MADDRKRTKKDVALPDATIVQARASWAFLKELAGSNTTVECLIRGVDDDVLDGELSCYVTLLQMAAICNRSKRSLRRLFDEGKLPAPAIEGSGGKPHEWRWSDVRPILEVECGKSLPSIFPSDRFIRS